MRHRGRLFALAAMIFSSVLAVPTTPDVALAEEWAPPTMVYMDGSGHITQGPFLSAWRGAADVLGLPISEEFLARSGFSTQAGQQLGTTQVFEHVALTLEEGPDGALVAVPLPIGQQLLDRQLASTPSPALQRASRRTTCPPDGSDCLFFLGNGHTIQGAFLTFWRDNAGDVWFGQPLTEAYRAADGSLVQYFEFGALRQRAQATVTPMALGRALAKKNQIDTDPVPQPAEVLSYDPDLFVDPNPKPQGWAVGSFGPGPQQGGYKEIVVSISQQALWAYENGEMVISTYVSTGTEDSKETTTPVGYHTILTKYPVQTMSGVINDEEYNVPDVPDVMYFDNDGNALHGAYWHNNFGSKMSHGCVNLPLDVAHWMYEWAPIGTAVTVIP